MAQEKITPVTEDEIDNIRVTLELDGGEEAECRILTIFDVDGESYIALLPLDENGEDNASGEVYLYRYREDAQGIPDIANITDEDEYEAACDRFDELLDEALFDSMD